jgi:hypothetical protein
VQSLRDQTILQGVRQFDDLQPVFFTLSSPLSDSVGRDSLLFDSESRFRNASQQFEAWKLLGQNRSFNFIMLFDSDWYIQGPML